MTVVERRDNCVLKHEVTIEGTSFTHVTESDPFAIQSFSTSMSPPTQFIAYPLYTSMLIPFPSVHV